MEATRHAACGTRPVDWVDEDGRFHDPPLFEVVLDSCPGCAEIGRVQADFAAQLPKDPLEAQRVSAGVQIKVVPFDPRRDLVSAAEMMGATPSMTEPSLADPITGPGGRVLTPDD